MQPKVKTEIERILGENRPGGGHQPARWSLQATSIGFDNFRIAHQHHWAGEEETARNADHLRRAYSFRRLSGANRRGKNLLANTGVQADST
jgi:hypothetical protein